MKAKTDLETKIREAKKEDLPRIKEISKEAHIIVDQRSIYLQIDSYFEDPKKYDVWKKNEVFEKKVPLSQKFYVAEDITQKVLGYAGIERPNIDGNAQGAYWLNWTGVDPKYQGKGIGTKMLMRTIREAKKRGATTISVKTDSQAESAHRTYEKLGFKQAGRVPKYYGKDLDLVIYSLDLGYVDLRNY